MRPRQYRCPACGHKTGVAIVYGMPSHLAREMAERGEIVLGGCCIDLESAERQCRRCGHEWRIQRKVVPIG